MGREGGEREREDANCSQVPSGVCCGEDRLGSEGRAMCMKLVQMDGGGVKR